MSFSTVSVIGLGYIGLPTATVLAASGIDVIGVDVNPHAVETINRGEIHIVEPDLDALVHQVVNAGRLRAVLAPEAADAFLIAVPTPFRENHEPDLRFIESAARSLAPVLKKGDLIILESTSPVGATEQMAAWLADSRPDLTFPQQVGEASDIRVAYCPERVLPGQVLRELVQNDRVIGGMTAACTERAIELYRSFVKGECIRTSARTAEMCKLTENAFRDVNIAFANELSMICSQLGIDVWELIRLANHHPRVNILQPGTGVGGHCIAVDPWFIVSKSPEQARLIAAARGVNDGKPHWVVDKIVEAAARLQQAEVGKRPGDIRIACLGLAFKPNIDDLRESPAIEVVKQLEQTGYANIVVVEPNVDALPAELGSLPLVTLDEAIGSADLICVLVKHDQFKSMQLEGSRAVLVDFVGLGT